MSDLYNEDIFKNRGAATPTAKSSGSNLLLIVVGIVIVVIAVGGLLYWKKTHDPATMIMDINKASETQLEGLPGVGKVTAGAIIDGRPYQSVEDLKKIRGIGEKTFERLKPRVKVE